MPTYDDITLEPIYPILEAAQHLHIAIYHDELSMDHGHKQTTPSLVACSGTTTPGKKGNRWSIHVSYFILEMDGQLVLTTGQLEAQAQLQPDQWLGITNARKIIFPGKNGDAWWDMQQLLAQIKLTIPIFEYIQPGAIGV